MGQMLSFRCARERLWLAHVMKPCSSFGAWHIPRREPLRPAPCWYADAHVYHLVYSCWFEPVHRLVGPYLRMNFCRNVALIPAFGGKMNSRAISNISCKACRNTKQASWIYSASGTKPFSLAPTPALVDDMTRFQTTSKLHKMLLTRWMPMRRNWEIMLMMLEMLSYFLYNKSIDLTSQVPFVTTAS